METEGYSLTAALEAILFAAGDPVPAERIAKVLGEEESSVLEAADALAARYTEQGSGIRLLRLDQNLQLCSAPAYSEFVTRALEQRKPPRLSMVVDYFTANLNNRKRVCIVSKDYDRIRRFIIDDLVRGCTLYEVIGGYTNEKSIELEALLTKDEFSKLMEYINQNDVKAFITAGNVSEVYGLWFKDKKRTKQHAEQR